MIVQYNVEEITYKGKHKGIVIGSYNHLWQLGKRHCPLFATLLSNSGMISQVTRQKDGVVYIPISDLQGVKKFKICSGKGSTFKYRVVRNVEILAGGFIVRGEATDYDRNGRIEFNQETKGVAV